MKTFNESGEEFKRNYRNVHFWLRNKFGNASKCEGIECNHKSRKFNYALKTGSEYKKIRENFLELCISCHRKYDLTDEIKNKMSESRIGLQNHRTKIKGIDNNGNVKIYSSIKEASIINKSGRGSIVDVLKGRRNSCYNIKYTYA